MKERHLTHLRLTFERRRKHNLKMNSEKCKLGVSTAKFLVHRKGIEVDQNKAKAVLEAAPLANKNELQSFLGKMNFLRRFIPNLSGRSRIFAPLVKLKVEQNFVWESCHQEAFNQIKHYLTNPPVMMPAVLRRPLKLYISMSEETKGSLLAQEDENGVGRVVYYRSQVLNDAEKRYNVIEQLSIVFFSYKVKNFI